MSASSPKENAVFDASNPAGIHPPITAPEATLEDLLHHKSHDIDLEPVLDFKDGDHEVSELEGLPMTAPEVGSNDTELPPIKQGGRDHCQAELLGSEIPDSEGVSDNLSVKEETMQTDVETSGAQISEFRGFEQSAGQPLETNVAVTDELAPGDEDDNMGDVLLPNKLIESDGIQKFASNETSTSLPAAPTENTQLFNTMPSSTKISKTNITSDALPASEGVAFTHTLPVDKGGNVPSELAASSVNLEASNPSITAAEPVSNISSIESTTIPIKDEELPSTAPSEWAPVELLSAPAKTTQAPAPFEKTDTNPLSKDNDESLPSTAPSATAIASHLDTSNTAAMVPQAPISEEPPSLPAKPDELKSSPPKEVKAPSATFKAPETPQNKTVLMAELKAMKIVRCILPLIPQPSTTSQMSPPTNLEAFPDVFRPMAQRN
jgi:hypothetical protein